MTATTLPARHRETTALLGMSVIMASWAMLFAALFFAYGLTRVRAVAWPPADLPRLPLLLPALATVAIGLSSAALLWARRQSLRARAAAGVGVALAGAGAFLAAQLLVWQAMFAAGLRPAAGPYASVFYGLTAFHALHVAVGMVGLMIVLARLLLAGPAHAGLGLRLWALYAHMVGVLWALIYLGVYLL